MSGSLPFPFVPGETIDPRTEAAVVQKGGGSISGGTIGVSKVTNAHDAAIESQAVPGVNFPTTLDTVGITFGAYEGAVSYTTQGSDDSTGTNLDGLGGIALANTGKFSTTFSSTNPILVGVLQPSSGTVELTGDSYIIGTSGNDILLETVITLPGGLDSTIGNRPLVVDSVISNSAITTDGSVNYSFSATGAIPCFAAGTAIRTPRGEIAVASLAVGDEIVLHDGRTAPVTWIGHREVDLTAHARPHLVRPVVIRAGALADTVPSRDLTVSPDHALFIDGRLVPAKLLVNGASIVQDEAVRSVTYYHVELATHAVLLAENTPAESFLNGGNKAVFDASVATLHPSFDNAGIEGCAPRVAAIEPSLWAAIARRAEAVLPTPAVTGFRLVADGRPVRPLLRDGDRVVFAVPTDAVGVAIVSDTHVPAVSRPWEGDCRTLGIAIERVSVRRDGTVLDLPLDLPVFGAGWHDLEVKSDRSWRWTDGNAALAVRAGDIVELTVTGMAGRQVALAA